MDYGRLIRDAWVITWRHRFLWFLGLFAGGSAGACSSSRFNFNFPGQFSTGGGNGRGRGGSPNFQPFVQWLTDNVSILITIAVVAVAVVVLIWLVFKVISLVAQGGMVRATADIATGQPSLLGPAIRAGLGYFWRFAGLWLLLIALAVAIALSVGGSLVLAIAFIALVDESIRPMAAVLAISLGVAALLVLVPALILFNIVVAYAQRAMVVEDAGPISAIRRGTALLLASFWTSLLAWLINVAIGIVAGLFVLILLALTAVPLAVFGILFGIVIGFGVPVFAYAALALLVIIAVLWFLSAVVNTYFWSYWTIAYLRLTGRPVAL